MNTIYNICIGLSTGILGGFIAGGIKLAVKKDYSEKRIRKQKKLINFAADVLKYITMLLLALGLVWCCYFLLLGAVSPERIDYAGGMAELIVSVLTVISIIFAFVEFLKRADN